MTPLRVLETVRVIRIARPGALRAWLGPALRGLAGGRLRARACVLPVLEQMTTRRYCRGCHHMAGCAYGETVEPDPPEGVSLLAGWENAARPLVVAPAFPLPDIGQPGFTFPVRVVFVGPLATGHAVAFWDALRVGGADPMLGLGDDHILFDVLPPTDPADAARTSVVTLPTSPTDAPGEVARARVQLTGPLFLNAPTRDGERRRPVTRPTFGDLMRASLRTFGPLFRCYSQPLPEDVFGRVKDAAEKVPALSARFHPFGQDRHSGRSGDRYAAEGVIGEGTYGPVPQWLMPWLEWAGRVHVGTHRVAGAGGWVMI